MTRTIIFFGCVPVTMKPPISTLSPVSTRKRVEMFPRIAGEALGVAVGEDVGVSVGVPVGVTGGVSVEVAVGVAGGVGDAVELGVGVGPDCAQYFPPVFSRPPTLPPPHTIISLPVHTPG